MTNDAMKQPEVRPKDEDPDHDHARDTLRVTVRYAAALKPFIDEDANRNETLGALRSRVLEKFELTDGGTAPDGGAIVYKLYHGKDEITDLSRTLGDIAGHARDLQLKLSQFIQQGRRVLRESAG